MFRRHVGVVPDIEPVAVYMLGYREPFVVIRLYMVAEVGLPYLVTAPGAASTELDTGVAHNPHKIADQVGRGVVEYDLVCVVARATDLEVGKENLGV